MSFNEFETPSENPSNSNKTNKDAPSQQESHVIVLHLSKDQNRWLENTAAFITNETGCQVSHSSIMMRLMAIGLPAFEQEMASLRAKDHGKRKRFHNLQLVYSRINA